MKKIFLLILFFLACLEKPKFPEWDTEITIPLLEKNLTIFSFLDSHYFKINSDSVFNFFYQNDFDTVFPITKINLNISGFNASYYFNNFEIYDTFYNEITVNIEEILGITIFDSFVILPPINQRKNLKKILNLNDIRNGFIEEIFMIIEIENYSPINFEYFEIDFNNFYINLENIRANSQKKHSEKFSDIFISSPSNIFLNYQILTEDSVLVRKRDFLKIIIKFTKIRLREGELKLKKAYLEHIYNYNFVSSGFELRSGKIKEGFLELEFINQFPFPLLISFKIKEINYENSFNISPYTYKKISLPLEGKSIRQNSFDRKGGLIVPIEISAQINDTGKFFNIKKENYFSLTGCIENLKFKEIEGNFLFPYYFVNKEDSIVINFLGNPKGIKFEKGEILLEFWYNIKMPIRIFLTGKSINRNQEICSLYKEICLPVGNGQPLNKLSERIDITNLINNGPRILKFSYSAKIDGQGKIEEKDFVLLNVSVDIPLKFSFVKDTFIAYKKEIFISGEESEKIKKNLLGGELIVEATNHFPIGFDGSLIIKSKEEGDSIVFPFMLLKGEVSEKGYCEKEKESKIILEIKEDQLEIFKKEKLEALLKINLPESDTVVLKPNDFLSFKSYGILKIKTKEMVKSIKK
ncbi:MAG: hypothetical protein ABIK77_03050 [candidate division WOR-3 bacterium]